MKKIISIIAILVLIIVLIVTAVIFASKERDKAYENALLAQRMLDVNYALSISKLHPDYNKILESERLFYYIGSRIEKGKLYISLYDSKTISRKEQKENVLCSLSEYEDIIKFEFYTYDYILTVKKLIEKHFLNTEISNLNEISISEDTGKISFLAYIGGKGPEEDEKKKIIEFITSMEAKYNVKIEINYLAAYLE